MPSQPDPLDHALKLLRSRGAALSNSFSLELEDRLMREQQQQLQGGRWTTRGLVAGIVLCGILAAGAASYAASYAATGGWRGLLRTFLIESDGVVTNEDEQPVGGEFQNADGSYTTIIQSEENDQSYAITTAKSAKGKTLRMLAVPPDQLREDQRRRAQE